MSITSGFLSAAEKHDVKELYILWRN